MNLIHFSSQTPEWATPQDLFDKLNSDYHFTLDVAATAENAKCKKFFTAEDDGLQKDWSSDVCWMNPPYGRGIIKWIAKAHDAWRSGATVVCLLPSRTDTRWFHKYCVHGRVEFIAGRIKFGGSKCGAPFPSMLVHFDDTQCMFCENKRRDGKFAGSQICVPCYDILFQYSPSLALVRQMIGDSRP